VSVPHRAARLGQSKIDERPFRGDWCNQNNAGLGPFPRANPNSSFTHLYAYVWIKPPGESDGDYPTWAHSHDDPHWDPNGTVTGGNGTKYPSNSIPGFDIPAGQWFPAEFGCSSRTPSRPSGNRGSHAGAGLVPVQPRCLAGLKTRLARETFLSFGGNHACHRRDRHACLYRARRRA